MSDADERHERPGGRWLPVAVLRPFAPAHLPDVECISHMAELMRQVRVERRGRWPITSARNSTPGPPCRLLLRHRHRAPRRTASKLRTDEPPPEQHQPQRVVRKGKAGKARKSTITSTEDLMCSVAQWEIDRQGNVCSSHAWISNRMKRRGFQSQ